MFRRFFSQSPSLQQKNSDKLPCELWKIIFDYLTNEERIVAMYVCRDWFNFLYESYDEDIKKAVQQYHNPANFDKEHDNNLVLKIKNHPGYRPIKFSSVLKDTLIFTPMVTSLFHIVVLFSLLPDVLKDRKLLRFRNYVLFLMLQGSLWGTLIFCTGLEKYVERLSYQKAFMLGKKASLRISLMDQLKVYLDKLILPKEISDALEMTRSQKRLEF